VHHRSDCLVARALASAQHEPVSAGNDSANSDSSSRQSSTQPHCQGLIDVSTPQGLAPPVRNSTAARANISNRKNNPLPWKLKPHPDAAAAASTGNNKEEDGAQADLAMPDLPGGSSSGGGDDEEPPKLLGIVSEEEHVQVTLGQSGDEHELLGKSSETMESEGTEYRLLRSRHNNSKRLGVDGHSEPMSPTC